MAKISEVAKNYESTSKTKNIAELDKVSTDLELVRDTFEFEKDGQTKTVQQQVIEVEGEKFRVPVTVIQQLKVILEDNPELKNFKVKKSGTTKDDTRYQVIPLMN
jgi:predicted transcriptional regulator